MLPTYYKHFLRAAKRLKQHESLLLRRKLEPPSTEEGWSQIRFDKPADLQRELAERLRQTGGASLAAEGAAPPAGKPSWKGAAPDKERAAVLTGLRDVPPDGAFTRHSLLRCIRSNFRAPLASDADDAGSSSDAESRCAAAWSYLREQLGMHRRSSVSTTAFMPDLPAPPTQEQRESDAASGGKGSRLGRRKSLKPARHKDALLEVSSWQAFEQVALQASHSQRRNAALQDDAAPDWGEAAQPAAPALRAALKVHATTQLQGTWATPIPFKQSHHFVYRITFENVGDVPIQILGRRWRFTDAQGVHVVNVGSALQPAPGVIGAQPVVAPGHSCEYYSQCSSYSGQGSMEGGFYCRALTDAEAKAARKGNPNRLKPDDEVTVGDSATHFWAQVAPARLDASDDPNPLAGAVAPHASVADASRAELDASAKQAGAKFIKQLKLLDLHGEGKAFQLQLDAMPTLTKEHLARLMQELNRRQAHATSVEDMGGMPPGAQELLVRLMQGLGQGFTISASKDGDDDDVTQVTVFIDSDSDDGDTDDSDSDEEDEDLR